MFHLARGMIQALRLENMVKDMQGVFRPVLLYGSSKSLLISLVHRYLPAMTTLE